MAAAIFVVVLLAWWDARREAEGALVDVANEQTTLARSVASALSARLANLRDRGEPIEPSSLLAGVRDVERPGNVRLFVSAPGAVGFVGTSGAVVRDAAVERAVARGTEWVRLERTEAPAFDLPERMAVAGLASFRGDGGRWSVAVAATARRERDRASRAAWRSIGAVVVASGLVLLFGGVAMRKQRQELTLSRELAVAELERQREEQLLRIDKLATLAALSTGIAHEVATPLGVIVGRAEQLLPKVSHDERATKGVQSIIEQGTRIDRVVRGFLDLARGESPSHELVAPESVARAAAELVEHRFEKASVRLSFEAAADLPKVACDPRLLEQVVINLLQNGCDACSAGGHVELSVRAEGERVSFVVSDDGAGISSEAAARAVEPFFTTKPAGKGTGLGLAIAHEILKHHGGDLRIEPRKGGRGTRAVAALPATTGGLA
ncbi:MAG TPA: ATP-binding protein [Polyangiaceae bacterium]|nr:ATP-binding protein [Polyangiaceae bacterium]